MFNEKFSLDYSLKADYMLIKYQNLNFFLIPSFIKN